MEDGSMARQVVNQSNQSSRKSRASRGGLRQPAMRQSVTAPSGAAASAVALLSGVDGDPVRGEGGSSRGAVPLRFLGHLVARVVRGAHERP